MAASLGLAHEACYAAGYPPAAAAASSYSYFPSPPGGRDLVADQLFPPPAADAATTMADADDDGYFQLFGHQDMVVGARARARPGGCAGYCSPPMFDNNGMSLLSYGGGVDNGDDGMRRPTTMSGLLAGTAGGNGGGGRRLASRIGFRTRSEVDVLDDGFKWRKYGKKAVKSSPNPRNYYRCSSEGCGVKKRVERDCDDPRYVVTTYDGVHNHAAPGAAKAYLCRPQPPPSRGTSAATPFSAPLACSASASAAPPLAAAPPSCSWSAAAAAAAFDAWEARLAAAHSSESSY